MSNRAARPYQGHVDADPKGASWPGWNRTSVADSWFKARRPRQQSNRSSEPPTGFEPAPVSLQTRRSGHAELQGHRALDRIRTCPVLADHQHLKLARIPTPPRAHGASGRSRTACLSLTRGPLCQVSYRGVAAHRGFEPRLPDPESGVLPIERMGIACGRRESNACSARGGIRTRTYTAFGAVMSTSCMTRARAQPP